MDRDRRAAYLILKDVQDNGSWSNLALGKQFSAEKPVSSAFVRELVYGVLRDQFLLDFNIDAFLQKPKLKSSERILLRMGFYQLAKMDVADHAAINETVALAKSFIRGKEGFINAVLRSFQRAGSTLELPDNADIFNYYSVKFSADTSIVEHLIKAYGKERAVEILNNSNAPAKLCIRVNLIKTSRADLISRLKALGFECELSETAETAVFVKGAGLLDTDLYRDGLFSVQGEESQLAVLILDPKPGSLMMDLCAAPGGKACACAERMNNEGQILAFDIYRHRAELIKKEAKRLGLGIIDAALSDASVLNEEYLASADYVLADVPCSVLGTARKNPEIKLRRLESAMLPDIQKRILANAGEYLKPGGRLVYSTCTLNPAENDKLTEEFISSHVNYSKEFEKQFYPDKAGCEGFYICSIRKDK